MTSKTMEDLYEYRERKHNDLVRYSRSMEMYTHNEMFTMADTHRERMNETQAMIIAIDHCIDIVRRNEQDATVPKTYKRMVGRKMVEEPWPFKDR